MDLVGIAYGPDGYRISYMDLMGVVYDVSVHERGAARPEQEGLGYSIDRMVIVYGPDGYRTWTHVGIVNGIVYGLMWVSYMDLCGYRTWTYVGIVRLIDFGVSYTDLVGIVYDVSGHERGAARPEQEGCLEPEKHRDQRPPAVRIHFIIVMIRERERERGKKREARDKREGEREREKERERETRERERESEKERGERQQVTSPWIEREITGYEPLDRERDNRLRALGAGGGIILGCTVPRRARI